jgi:phage repressor protein C with HTH and peptisase S24 domain
MRITQETLNRRFNSLTEPGSSATVIERIKYLIKFNRQTQAQFGEVINVDPSNMSKILSGRIPMTDQFINRIVVDMGVSKDWLLYGTDVPFPRAVAKPFNVVESGEVANGASKGTPIYDIDVAAGTAELSQMFTEDRIIGFLNMQQVEPDQAIIRVSGNSMDPTIPNGSFISLRPISDNAPLCWGQVYVILTEDYRLVKTVRRHPEDKNMIILHSENPAYDDMEIDRALVKKFYLVTAVLTYNVLG